MGFSREDLEAYEKLPQTEVPKTANPFAGATPAQAATAEQLAAVAAQNASQAALQPATDDEADPSGTDEGNSEDQSVTGDDGTSDENADSSTASADPSGDSDSDEGTNSEGEGTNAPNQRAPKKGSAAERIQELLDLVEGYKEFGTLKIQELREAQAEIARIKGGGTVTSVPAAESKPVAGIENDPMPDMSDADVNFDTDKLRAKTQKWIQAQVKSGVKTAIAEFKGSSESEVLKTAVDSKISKFSETHDDWKKTVADNQTLIKNQLGPDAAITIAKSPFTAEILYHFGKNPDLAVSTAKLSAAEQILVVGEVVAKIKADKAAEAAATNAGGNTNKGNSKPNAQGNGKTVPGAQPGKQKSLTQAPPPPSPTRAGGRAQPRDILDPQMSMDEFARRHREEKQAKRQANRQAQGR
jgi:hypothetical protein